MVFSVDYYSVHTFFFASYFYTLWKKRESEEVHERANEQKSYLRSDDMKWCQGCQNEIL